MKLENTPPLLPISIYQKRFFLEWLLDPNSSAYNPPIAFKMNSELNSAITSLMKRVFNSL